jgi:hypothetical protein
VLNQEKIKIMTKLAIYEQEEGKEDLAINKYFKTDYIRFQLIKEFVCYTMGCILILMLVAMYQLEYLIINTVNLDFVMIGKFVLVIYIMVSIFYIIIASFRAITKYNNSKKNLSRYRSLIKKLNDIYAEDKVNEQQGGRKA